MLFAETREILPPLVVYQLQVNKQRHVSLARRRNKTAPTDLVDSFQNTVIQK